MTIRTGTLTLTIPDGGHEIVPAGSTIDTTTPDGADAILVVSISYDYAPFRLITTPAFDFLADRIDVIDGQPVITRDVECVSLPGGNGRSRTYRQKD